MKKGYHFFAVLVLLMSYLPQALAYEGSVVTASGQTIYFRGAGAGVYITYPSGANDHWGSFTKPIGNLIIPDSVMLWGNYFPVIGIDAYAFHSCSGLTSVTIPKTITNIEPRSFISCSNLSTIIVDTGNAYYDSRDNCNAIIYTNTNALVVGCINTTIPNSVTRIGEAAFAACSGLTFVSIPNTVTYINDYAFSGCTDLISVTLPQHVAYIGDYAFSFCSGLTSVTIPQHVTHIGDYAFSNCSGLTSVTFNADSCTFMGFSTPVFYNCPSLTTLSIGNNVKVIPNMAFSQCSGLTSVTIPDSVISIGSTAFFNCSGLASVTIGNSVTYIGNYAFYNCQGLISVTIPNSVTSIGNNAFYNCQGLTSVTIGNSVTSIGNEAFRGCSGLTSVSLPNSVQEIGSRTFFNCGNLSSVSMGNDVSSIANQAFGNCIKLTNVTIGDNTLNLSSYDSTLISINADFPSTNAWNHSVIIKANWDTIPEHHYFQWSNGSTLNIDTIIVTSDSNLTASFLRYSHTLTVNVNDESLGNISFPNGNIALYLDTIMIVAHPINHYHVASWQGATIVSQTKDTAWITMMDDCVMTCNIAIDTYYVNVVPNNIERGAVSGGGEFVYGTPCTLEAIAYTGYTFHGWSNGVTANPYTFAPTENIELIAIFLAPGEETYTVTASSNNSTMGSALVNGGNSATVISGESVTLMATANDGYHFVRWNDDNTEATRTITVTEDMSFTAYFEPDGTQGVDEVTGNDIRIYAENGRIYATIDGQIVDEFCVYDIMGRRIASVTNSDKTPILTHGVYLVKIGNYPARKVVVI